MRISDVATLGVEVVASEVSVRQAAEKMNTLDVGALPVVDEDDALVGIISDRDIILRAVALGLNCSTTTVGQVMTVDVARLGPDAELNDAADLMQQRQVRRLPLVDTEGHAVGILSLADLATRLDGSELAVRVLQSVSRPASSPGS